ncbi:thymidine phosphorylase [Cololabis saira]|uniref:thymidine phosphorylase n=1 Tax=Cololabis saira TaxID=129043 RepID=UPI002AD3481B|nr:thymidine phosphorylase [Cololabis saira]XP_061570280.1 thymidine phosphorylase [Cololabis saira]XP_061570281.1 thymidine phosphorylase [Cololabis saira]XP_061570282.1 thymidine phosphorylase [Cololabis saira]
MLSIPDLIRKKRDGEELSDEEIRFFIRAVASKTIQDCQTGAMLMAIWLKGMVSTEITTLTREMMSSGEVMSWPEKWRGLVVDKHSTGGVGDKVSLVLAPALAACGCKVPMISGRGLAHTGGTLDKLESIPGFNIYQSAEQVLDILDSVGCCIVGQTETLVPADRVLYALRDATSTVDSLPLITGSIISKKGAESLSALVLDVKFGRAALYKDLQSAKELAKRLVEAGNRLGIRTAAALSRMDATIGRCVGNSLEVIESLETLKGNGPDDLMELVSTLGGILLKETGLASDLSEGRKKISEAVIGGAALSRFEDMMKAQGVAPQTARSLCSTSDYFSVLKKAKHQVELQAPADGLVLDLDGLVLAQVLQKLGAGRSKANEPVNHSVGAELLVSLGDPVQKGSPWLRLHYDDPGPSPEQSDQLRKVLVLGPNMPARNKPARQPLVAELLITDP